MTERNEPPLMVAAVIRRTEGGKREVLICRLPDAPYKDAWTFPSGPMDRGESAEESLRRALHTSLEMDVQIEYGQPPFDAEYDQLVCRWRYYFCDATCSEYDESQFAELRWVPPGALREYDFEPVAKQVVDWMLSQMDEA